MRVCALIFPDIMGSGRTNCMSSYINLFRCIVEAGLEILLHLKVYECDSQFSIVLTVFKPLNLSDYYKHHSKSLCMCFLYFPVPH
jgi:hypothetical protein